MATLQARLLHALAPVALAASGLLGSGAAMAQQTSDRFFADNDIPKAAVHPPCRGKVRSVSDTAFEGVKTTAWNFGMVGGGGESTRFDKTPVLSTKLTLTEGCLNAHFSAMVGSQKTYTWVSSLTMFQVTLTPSAGGAPIHMVGHYETPYGIYGPAVALSAEHDVDMLASNFYQGIGTGPGLVAPGTYRVDVWWAGGLVGGGGAIGAAFVLKLYFY